MMFREREDHDILTVFCDDDSNKARCRYNDEGNDIVDDGSVDKVGAAVHNDGIFVVVVEYDNGGNSLLMATKKILVAQWIVAMWPAGTLPILLFIMNCFRVFAKLSSCVCKVEWQFSLVSV